VLDLALVSRFFLVPVPTAREIRKKHPEFVSWIGDHLDLNKADFTKEWVELKKTKVPSSIEQLIKIVAPEVCDEVWKLTNVEFSGRQVSDLYRVWRGYFQFIHFMNINRTQEQMIVDMCSCVVGLIPEATNLVQQSCQLSSHEKQQLLAGVMNAVGGVFSGLEVRKSETELKKLLEKDELTEKGLEKVLNIVNPDKWRVIRETLPKSKTWKRVNSIMAARSLSRAYNLNEIPTIKNHLKNY
jgi:hypothetical protein